MADFQVRLHTVYVLIGPSNSGKSYFSKNVLIPTLQQKLNNIQYISSDDIRRQLLGNANLDKYNMEMLEASAQSFTMLYTMLDNVTQFPITPIPELIWNF